MICISILINIVWRICIHILTQLFYCPASANFRHTQIHDASRTTLSGVLMGSGRSEWREWRWHVYLALDSWLLPQKKQKWVTMEVVLGSLCHALLIICCCCCFLVRVETPLKVAVAALAKETELDILVWYCFHWCTPCLPESADKN